MKPRADRPALRRLPEPPPELRQFTDPSRPGHEGPDLGVNVYPGRVAWLAARRAWEMAHGFTIESWFDVVTDDALRRDGLQAMNEAFVLYFTEDDEDDEDPRILAGAPRQP